MQDLMKQAKKMQQDLAKAQEELANTVVEGTSGGGMVKVQMNGKNQVLTLKIDPEVVDPEDIEKKCTETYIRAVLKADHAFFDNAENIKEFEAVTGGKVPNPEKMALLKERIQEEAKV